MDRVEVNTAVVLVQEPVAKIVETQGFTSSAAEDHSMNDMEINADLLNLSISQDHTRDPRDFARYQRNRRKKERKRRKKLRRRGGIRPQGDEILPDRRSVSFDELTEKRSLSPKIEEQRKAVEESRSKLRQLLDRIKPTDEEFFDASVGDPDIWAADMLKAVQDLKGPSAASLLTNVLVRMSGYLYAISKCASSEEIMDISIAVLAQYFDFEQAESLYRSCIAGLVPQASEQPNVFAKIRSFTTNMEDSPTGKFLFNMFSLSVLSGVKAHEMVPHQQTRSFLLKIQRDIFKSVTAKSYMDTVLDIGEYVFSAYEAFKKGTKLTDFLFPNTLQQQIVDAVLLSEKIDNGDLGNVEADFIDDALQRLQDLADVLKRGAERTNDIRTRGWMTAGNERVLRARRTIEYSLARSEYRKAPLCIGLYGKSQIGKTNLYPLLINTYACALGKTFKRNQIASIGGSEKYDDMISNATRVLQIDDVNSIKTAPGQAAESSIAKIVRIVNNVASPTNQADVSKKAYIFHREELVVCSSNDQIWGANTAYNCPISGTNRIHMVEVELLKEFEKDGKLDVDKALSVSAGGAVSPPLHRFRVYDFRESKVGPGVEHVYLTDWMETKEFLEYYVKLVKKHDENQEQLLQKAMSSRFSPMCANCCMPKQHYCSCGGPVFVPDNTLKKMKEQAFYDAWAFDIFEEYALHALHGASRLFGRSIRSRYARSFQRNAFRFVIFFLKCALHAFKHLDNKELRFMAIGGAGYMLYLHYYVFSTQSLYIFYIALLIVLLSAFLGYGSAVMDTFIYETGRSFANHELKSALVSSMAVCTIIGLIRTVYTMYVHGNDSSHRALRGIGRGAVPSVRTSKFGSERAYEDWLDANYPVPPASRVVYGEQGNLLPKVYTEIMERSKEPCPWTNERVRPVVMDHRAETMTQEHVINKLRTSMYKIRFIMETRAASCFALCLCDTIWAVPKHVWKKSANPYCQVMLMRDKGVVLHSSISAYFEPEGDYDVVLVQILGIGDYSDLVHLLCDEKPTTQICAFVQRDEDMNMYSTDVLIHNGPIMSSSKVLPSQGMLYRKHVATKDGDCGSVLVTKTQPRIIGLHCGGDGLGNCAATYIYKKWVLEFQLRTARMKGEGNDPMPFAYDESLNLDPYKKGPPVETEFDPRHCVASRESEEGGVYPVTYTPGSRIKPHSEVKYGMLKPILEKLHMPIMYGPPQFHSDRDHDALLEAKLSGMTLIPPPLMEKAIRDYVDPIIEEMSVLRFPACNPLSLDEVLNGREGDRFIGPMKSDTAAGFGLKGTKEKELIEVTKLPDGRRKLYPTAMLLSRFDTQMLRLREGRRLNPVFRTSLKDEPVKYEDDQPKKANRVFYAGQADSLCCAKAIFGPVASVIMSLPLLSECAGGINSCNNEWSQLYAHVTRFGKDKILAGDYKNWDAKVSSQLIRACGVVCLKIAYALGYPEADLLAMNGLISDIAVSFVSFNGAVCLFDGLMPSGDYCTLLFNSIGNALLHRCAFFSPGYDGTLHIYSHVRFRDHVSMIFMGDDSLGSSRGDFSMRDMQTFCSSINLIYTDDKKNLHDIPPFANIDDVDFCKRKFRWEPLLNQYLAPLDLKSIDKALYMYREGELDEVSATCQVIESQMREYARHEEHVFLNRREMLIQATIEAGIYLHVQRILNRSREDWLLDFRKRYFPDDDIGCSFDTDSI